MRWIGALLAAAALAMAGCGSSDVSKEDAVEAARALLETSGYLPAYRDCLIGEIKERLSPEEIHDLAELPESQRLKAAAKFVTPAEFKCKQEAGGRVIDPNASSVELAPLKDSWAQTLGVAAVESGATGPVARCVERRVTSMPDAKFIELGNAGFNAQAQQIARLAKPCVGE